MKPTRKRINIPVLSWALRNWLLLVCTAIFFALSQWEEGFAYAGMLIFGPLAVCTALTLNSLACSIWLRKTVDRDNADGTAVAEWRALDPRTRQILTVIVRCTLFLGTCIIIASRK